MCDNAAAAHTITRTEPRGTNVSFRQFLDFMLTDRVLGGFTLVPTGPICLRPCYAIIIMLCHGRVQTCRPMGACIACLMISVAACVVGVGAEPAQHVYRLTWAATCRLVRCWNRSNLVRGQRIPVSRGGHVTGKSGHARTCSGKIDDVISSAGARGGALLRSTVPARGPGRWERTRMGTSGERYKNPCATAVREDR